MAEHGAPRLFPAQNISCECLVTGGRSAGCRCRCWALQAATPPSSPAAAPCSPPRAAALILDKMIMFEGFQEKLYFAPGEPWNGERE